MLRSKRERVGRRSMASEHVTYKGAALHARSERTRAETVDPSYKRYQRHSYGLKIYNNQRYGEFCGSIE
jgi:hypothetical protein